ncbi:endolysin [Microbacterium phage Floof]|uniref:Endolysin n=1 Tax=Microbacterium phage Floof TaxID=2201433 RepID=A0A2Z4Q5M5_9CAUD|nr:endolysin [Microbacterium phage Floof]
MQWPNGSKTRPSITSGFGPRKAPVPGASTFHRGTDFVGFSTVRAIAAGTVEAVGTPSGWGGGGLQVWLRHGDGSLSRYMHLRSYNVRRGEHVGEGAALGIMGATGNVSGVHLHLEIVPAGASAQVDAVGYIQARLAGTAAATTSELTRQRQDWLNHSRGEKLSEDGIQGAATTAAIKRYQGFLGVTADGIWGPGTQAAHQRYYDSVMAPAPAAQGPVTYRAIQAGLNKFGYGLAVDGIWGRKSSNALADFQRKRGLTPDRIVGPKTRAALGI